MDQGVSSRSERAVEPAGELSAKRSHAGRRWGLVALLIALVLAPGLRTGWMIWRNAVNVPLWDEWVLADFLRTLGDGTFRLESLWSPHNGHRVLLPRLVLLGLAKLSSWDVRWELTANWLFVLLTLALCARLVRGSFGPLTTRMSAGLTFLASLILYSWSQHDNWISGWQVQIFMVNCLAVSCVLAIQCWRGAWHQLLLALACAVAGAFCFGSGLVLFFLVALGVSVAPVEVPWKRRATHAGFAAIVGVLAAKLYVSGSLGADAPTQADSSLSLALLLVEYVCGFLGGPITRSGWSLTVGIGAAGASFVVLCSLWLWWKRPTLRASAWPWFLLGCYSIASAASAGVTRLGLGVEQAWSPRYATLALPLWVSALCLVALTWRAMWWRGKPHLALLATWATVVGWLSLETMFLSRVASRQSLEQLHFYRRDLEHGAAMLLRFPSAPPGSLELLFTESYLRDAAPVLSRFKLSVFKGWPHWPEISALDWIDDPSPPGVLETVAPDPQYQTCAIVRGHLGTEVGAKAIERVLIVVGDEVAAEAKWKASKETPGRRNGAQVGRSFEAHVPRFTDRPAGAPVRAVGVFKDGRRAVWLPGSLAFP